ncbi:carbon-nitrogen hydrolase family protein [Pelagibacteraceae bacterium]|nr:carbon-nitrogen hydrolase family protein [Pelagibacteraceae bacterium]
MLRVSCIQLKSNNKQNKNLKKTIELIKKSVKQKADFILTPEVSSLFSSNKKELLKNCTSMKKDIYLKNIKTKAKLYKKWILIGSMIIKIKKKKLVNRSILINPRGKIHSWYDKIHMFDSKLSKKEIYKESKTFYAGKKIKIAKLPWGKLGMSVCYDLRFPCMYRQMAQKGCIFFSVPSAFTETTGKKHWHTLLKARAIENFSYVFAPAQGGTHYNGRKTFGHSLIVSPDGKILKELKKSEGVLTVKIDPYLAIKLRKKIPSLNKKNYL